MTPVHRKVKVGALVAGIVTALVAVAPQLANGLPAPWGALIAATLPVVAAYLTPAAKQR